MPQVPSTLPGLLAAAAARGSGGFVFHLGDETVDIPVADLYRRARDRAAELGRAGVARGHQVGLLGPNCPQWVEWAWAIWLAGATLVPLPAPWRVRDRAAFSAQVAALATATGCSHIVGDERYLGFLGAAMPPKLDWARSVPPSTELVAPPRPPDLAMVLCTSGSTAAPKGVRMTHHRAVVWARTNAARAPAGTVPAMVSWLPFFHIGGLGALFEIVTPVRRHVLPMARFVRDPGEWLRLVSQTGACFTVGPSSAWAAALRALAKEPEGVDLSCLQGAFFNAEMVDPEVADRMARVCGPLGLAPGSVGVHYASSEAGMICQTRLGADLRIDRVDLDQLARSSRARPPRAGHAVKRVVSCGTPFPGVELCIGRPGRSAPEGRLPERQLPERQLGEIWVRGPGVTDGFVNLGRDDWFDGDWFRTGDLGYLAEGELFVTGRSNEVIVRLGEKYHPEDIEQAVQRATGLPPGSCVSFSPQGGRGGELVVVLESTRPQPPGGAEDLARAARAAVVNAIGLTPSQVLLVPRGRIPTTPNGKLQRGLARQLYERGELGPAGAVSRAPG